MARSRVKIGVFLQARIGSTRLPGKALLPLAGRPCLEIVMHALHRVRADVHALLTDEESTPAFRSLAKASGFELFTGPAQDVLARYCLAANEFQVTRVVRATGDNPLVSAELANRNLRLHERLHADLSRFRGAPLGTGVEVVETLALYAANMLSTDPYEHEHVTPYLLRRQERYRVFELPCPPSLLHPTAAVTLDTKDDYERIQRIFGDLYHGKPVKIRRLHRWLLKNDPPPAV
ncbi:MAG: acylneuraminate cytidylyltransferase [Spirochaetales bacterium]|nr:acylneuraminate cytidylyltransferase [Spirochaetales bacterium]